MAADRDFYSRLVGVLKVGLPLMALVLLASMFLVQTEDEFEGGIAFTEGDLSRLGEGLQITAPVLTGATRDGDPFRFTAAVVVPDAVPPTRAAISGLEGAVEFAGGPRVAIAAPEGAIDLGTEVMTLEGRVRVASEDGYAVVADRMEVDLLGGVLVAEGDVVGDGPMGRITAETLRVVPAEAEAGGERRVFSFGGGVGLVYGGADGTEF